MTKWLFRIFVFLLPTQLALHFWPEWALIYGIRVDYLAPAIYLTDLLLLSFLVFFFISKGWRLNFLKGKFGPLLLLGVFVLINIAVSLSPLAALSKWIKILELFLLFLLVKKAKNLDFRQDFLKPLFLSSAAFSLIGIIQFFKGATVGGPFYFLGERTFNVATPGIALVTLWGRDFMRAYSTFAHPNSMAGFLGIVLILNLVEKKKVFIKGNILIVSLIFAGILLTFSVSAWLSLVAVFVIYKLKVRNILPIAVIISFLIPFLFLWRNKITFSEDVTRRRDLASISLEMLKKSPIVGVGLNNYIVNLPSFSRESGVSWFLQPVHNNYLLVLAEAGVLGLLFFLGLLKKALNNSLSQKKLGIFLSLSFIVLVGIADHYFLTLQQNILLFAIILGYSLRHG